MTLRDYFKERFANLTEAEWFKLNEDVSIPVIASSGQRGVVQKIVRGEFRIRWDDGLDAIYSTYNSIAEKLTLI